MSRILCAAALFVVAALTPACNLPIFEDIGTDPHPPAIQIVSLSYYVAPPVETTEPTPTPIPTPDKTSVSLPGRSSTWDSGGFTLADGQTFQIEIAYSDSGGDIVKFHLRDRDGKTSVDLIPIDRTYFSGTSGTALGPLAGQTLTGIAGPHRLELWAEDSHLSRSAKVEFVIDLTF